MSVYYLVFFFLIFIYLFIYLWLCRVLVSVRGLSPVAASGGHSSSRCTGLSLSQPLLLRSTDSRRTGSVIVAHGPSCPTAYGIFPDQGSNPCPLHWQADSQPLRHQGSPNYLVFLAFFFFENIHNEMSGKIFLELKWSWLKLGFWVHVWAGKQTPSCLRQYYLQPRFPKSLTYYTNKPPCCYYKVPQRCVFIHT